MLSLNNCYVNYEEFGIIKTVACKRVDIHDNGACVLHIEERENLRENLIVIDIAHTTIYQLNS